MPLRKRVENQLLKIYGTTGKIEDALFVLTDGRLIHKNPDAKGPHAHGLIATMSADRLDEPSLYDLVAFLREAGLVRLMHFGTTMSRVTYYEAACGGLSTQQVDRVLRAHSKQWKQARKVHTGAMLYFDIHFGDEEIDTFEAETPNEALGLWGFIDDNCGPEWQKQ